MLYKKGNCVTCVKKKFSLLSQLTNEELKRLDEKRILLHYKKGETILKSGMQVPGLICLSGGKAKIFKELPGNKELIVHLAKPVEFIGFRELLGDEPCIATAVALEYSEICIIDKSHFFSVLEDNALFSKRIIKHLANELIVQDNRLLSLTQKFMRERLAETLVMLHEAYGDKEGFVSLTLSREEIASISNMSRSNVIKTLYEFEKENLVQIKGKKIKVCNREKLKNLGNPVNQL